MRQRRTRVATSPRTGLTGVIMLIPVKLADQWTAIARRLPTEPVRHNDDTTRLADGDHGGRVFVGGFPGRAPCRVHHNGAIPDVTRNGLGCVLSDQDHASIRHVSAHVSVPPVP